jgi:hypothetical protein
LRKVGDLSGRQRLVDSEVEEIATSDRLAIIDAWCFSKAPYKEFSAEEIDR